jgi:vWA-MoxR associated protein C-terminal domain/Effector-associated domain 2/vWA-MoxR associated protein middle region 0
MGDNLLSIHLDEVTTVEEFSVALQRLRVAAGSPSLRDLETHARRLGQHLPKSTVGEMLAGRRLPRRAMVMAFVRACGVDEDESLRWREAWERIAARPLHSPLATRVLDVADQNRLVTAFMMIESMRRRRDRDLYLSIVERELGHSLPLTRHDQDLYDVWQIVDTCLAFPGALHALVDVVKSFYGSSTSAVQLRELLAELLPEPLLEPTERRDLHRLVALLTPGRLASENLPALYRQAASPAAALAGPALVADRISDVIAYLEDMPPRDDSVPPLLIFIRNLAEHADGEIAVALRDWADRFAQRLGLPTTPQDNQVELDHDTAYLVIECIPDGAGSDGYLMSAWLKYDEEPAIRLYSDDEPQPLSRMAHLLESLLVKDPAVVNRHTPDLMIEFVLPRALLSAPVDQLKITSGGLERRLGIEYPVVVRSRDRLSQRVLRHHWRSKWLQLRNDPAAATAFRVTQPHQYESEQLYAMLAERTVACLAMAFPPLVGDSDPPDELWVGLQAGTPIVVWCRDTRDPGRVISELAALIDGDLMTLPQRVLELRRSAVQSADRNHPGNHLTLIFDDGDRIPEPYLSLRSPSELKTPDRRRALP